MQLQTAAAIAEAGVDPVALQQPPSASRRLGRRTVVFLVVGLLAYAAGLIALIPAGMLVGDSDRLKLGGTIWNGEAVLASTLRIEWTFSPLTSLSNLGFAADWRMTGGATDVSGTATRRGAMVRFDRVSGRADGTLLDALAPGLPVGCQILADVAIDHVQLGGTAQEATGTLQSAPFRCAAREGATPPVDLPAVRGTIAPGPVSSSGAISTASGQQDLIEVRLARSGALSIWPTPLAVRLMPSLAGKRYDTKID